MPRSPLTNPVRHFELKLFAAAYLLYNAGRWITVGDVSLAVENARWILRTEETLGIAVEHSVQDAIQSGTAMWLLSHAYLAAQFAVLPGALIYLYRRAPAIYRRLRDTVLATWLISLPVYAMFPVAPPRLAGAGFVDSVSAHAAVSLTGRSSILYNGFAAVPSLHCGFALAVGIALSAAARNPAAKALALLWGPFVCLTVVATGNHYVFDIAAGLVAALAGYVAGAVLRGSGGRIPAARTIVSRPQPAPVGS